MATKKAAMKYEPGTRVTQVRVTSGRKSAWHAMCSGAAPDKETWHSTGRAHKQTMRFDFEEGPRTLGGLVIDWGKDHATDYTVQARLGGGRWRVVDSITSCKGGKQFHYLPELTATGLRIVMNDRDPAKNMRADGQTRGYEIRYAEVHERDFFPTYTRFLAHMAKAAPRGHFPRHMTAEQSYWTVVGVEGGLQKSIINEEGMVELVAGGPSLEPFIFDEQAATNHVPGAKLFTWADSKGTVSLEEGYLPIPSVVRQYHGLELTVKAFADGEAKAPTLYVQYKLKNRSAIKRTGKLLVALRSFQVNPPWQVLNVPGGFAPVTSLQATEGRVRINNRMLVAEIDKADKFGAAVTRHGDMVHALSAGSVPSATQLRDEKGTAFGAWEYGYELAPSEERTVTLAVLLNGIGLLSSGERAFKEAKKYWTERLKRVDVTIPGGEELVNAMKSQIAYILVNREQHAIQPGTRNYRRSWIRDGALTCTALLQAGYTQEVKQFIEWYAPHVFENGKVPCVVDKNGADAYPEHDSHGEFLYLVTEYYRYTGDKQLIEKLFPLMYKVTKYIDELRQQRRTDEYKKRETEHFFGLLPESASHEGYMDRPAYSYWDDIFCCKGLADAAFIAKELGMTDKAKEISAIEEQLRSDTWCSIRMVMWRNELDYIPGSADRRDFDPTSTTIGLDPTWVLADDLPRVRRTFNRYWQHFCDRRDGRTEWNDYTPYEWRSVGAFLRLGSPERAHAVTDWFMNHRRPAQWNHWAEVVHRDANRPAYIGDMPHGWVGSDFLRSVRSMLVYETPDHIVVGAGLKPEWIKAGMVRVNYMPTRFGKISFAAQQLGNAFRYVINGKLNAPVEFVLPAKFKTLRVDGHLVVTGKSSITLPRMPALVEVIF